MLEGLFNHNCRNRAKKFGMWLCWTQPCVWREYIRVSGKYFLWDMRMKWKQQNGYKAFI